MASKREQIVQAAYQALNNLPYVNGRTFRSRVEAFQRAEAPAIVIEPGPDNATTTNVSTCYIDWNLTLMVMVIARGAVPDQAGDPIVCQVHTRLMADRTLGGLAMDIVPANVEPAFDSADRPSSLTLLTYEVRYRTSVEDIQQ